MSVWGWKLCTHVHLGNMLGQVLSGNSEVSCVTHLQLEVHPEGRAEQFTLRLSINGSTDQITEIIL